jgi:mRNA interferase RelE/StbE
MCCGKPSPVTSDYRTLVTPAARDELRRVPRTAALRILRRLMELEEDPHGFFTPGSIPMASRPERRALRIGDYRVIYTIDRLQVIVWAVQSTTPARGQGRKGRLIPDS